jgi:uncharacterized protein (DUF433 family)/DNA-binding transcriptional MerR regulator
LGKEVNKIQRMATNARAIGRYSAAEVGRLAGVSARRIGQWARYGIIPSVATKPRVYSYADAGEAILVRYLLELDYTANEVNKIVHLLRERFGVWPLATAPLEHDGSFLVLREDGDVHISVVRPEQVVAEATLFKLQEVRRALASGGWVAWKHHREHVEVNPDRLSGRPVVRGRRIATSVVADLARREEGHEILLQDFGLSDEEIADAVSYEADVEKAIAA